MIIASCTILMGQNMVRTTWQDDDERRVIEDVQEYGWHIVAIEDDDEGPGFAYSIGLYHTLKKPEIVIFGLKTTDMMNIINVVGEEMRKGKEFEDWMEYDQILDGYHCIFRAVDREFYQEYFGYARWFHEGSDFPVLQCVRPDRGGHYPWHSEFPAAHRARQPVLARQHSWPFQEGKNRAVFTTKNVIEGTYPILFVSHDEENDWQFLCGKTNRTEDGRLVCLGHVVEQHPAVAELADLPVGWQAERDGPDKPWRRMRNQADE
jgi:hypothetical protein